ncbi:MAG: tetratricopeptide repeat protein [Stellaceae bacterium]
MQGRRNSIARARAIYDGRLDPRGTKQMRGHLEHQAADSSALLATSTLCDYLNRWNDAGDAEIAKADAAVQHVLAINPNHHLGHYAKGFLHRTRGEHDQALAEFTETVKHSPRFARAIAQRGNELIYLGRPQEGIAEVQRAIAMTPKSPSLGMFQWIIGRTKFVMGEDAEAIDWLQKSVKSWPKLWYNRAYLIAAYAKSSKTGAAKRALQAFDKRFPGWTLTRVVEEEKANPNNNAFMVNGRRRFHDALLSAGMKAR